MSHDYISLSGCNAGDIALLFDNLGLRRHINVILAKNLNGTKLSHTESISDLKEIGMDLHTIEFRCLAQQIKLFKTVGVPKLFISTIEVSADDFQMLALENCSVQLIGCLLNIWGLGEYVTTFSERDLNGKKLSCLECKADLDEIGAEMSNLVFRYFMEKVRNATATGVPSALLRKVKEIELPPRRRRQEVVLQELEKRENLVQQHKQHVAKQIRQEEDKIIAMERQKLTAEVEQRRCLRLVCPEDFDLSIRSEPSFQGGSILYQLMNNDIIEILELLRVKVMKADRAVGADQEVYKVRFDGEAQPVVGFVPTKGEGFSWEAVKYVPGATVDSEPAKPSSPVTVDPLGRLMADLLLMTDFDFDDVEHGLQGAGDDLDEALALFQEQTSNQTSNQTTRIQTSSDQTSNQKTSSPAAAVHASSAGAPGRSSFFENANPMVAAAAALGQHNVGGTEAQQHSDLSGAVLDADADVDVDAGGDVSDALALSDRDAVPLSSLNATGIVTLLYACSLGDHASWFLAYGISGDKLAHLQCSEDLEEIGVTLTALDLRMLMGRLKAWKSVGVSPALLKLGWRVRKEEEKIEKRLREREVLQRLQLVCPDSAIRVRAFPSYSALAVTTLDSGAIVEVFKETIGGFYILGDGSGYVVCRGEGISWLQLGFDDETSFQRSRSYSMLSIEEGDEGDEGGGDDLAATAATGDASSLSSLSMTSVNLLLDTLLLGHYKKAFTASDFSGCRLEYLESREDLVAAGIEMSGLEFRYFMAKLADLKKLLVSDNPESPGETAQAQAGLKSASPQHQARQATRLSGGGEGSDNGEGDDRGESKTETIPLGDLDSDDVGLLLEALGLGEYSMRFQSKQLNGAKLEHLLSGDDLLELQLGVTRIDARLLASQVASFMTGGGVPVALLEAGADKANAAANAADDDASVADFVPSLLDPAAAQAYLAEISSFFASGGPGAGAGPGPGSSSAGRVARAATVESIPGIVGMIKRSARERASEEAARSEQALRTQRRAQLEREKAETNDRLLRKLQLRRELRRLQADALY